MEKIYFDFNSKHPEGIKTSLVVIFSSSVNKTLNYDKVRDILLKMDTIDRCIDIIDTCVALYGSIKLGNTSSALGIVQLHIMQGLIHSALIHSDECYLVGREILDVV